MDAPYYNAGPGERWGDFEEPIPSCDVANCSNQFDCDHCIMCQVHCRCDEDLDLIDEPIYENWE